jgi:ribosomal protein S12 methylthiotransferase
MFANDLIAGFPGETLEDVEELKLFCNSSGSTVLAFLPYSHEEGTSAFDLEDNIPQDEKDRRAQDIMEVQQEISYEKNAEKVNKITK